jgi:peptidoglycan/LPS O-acetylase OafA/YrhL
VVDVEFPMAATVSYMMDLIHIPVWVTLSELLQLGWPGRIPGLLVGLFLTVFTIALASISWRFVEKPILGFKNARFAIPKGAQAREDELLHPLSRIQRLFIRH